MSKDRPTVAVTGANGFIGSALVNYFSKENYQVVALVRDTAHTRKLANVSYRAYDLAGSLPTNLLDGVDYLIHAAYIKGVKKNKDAYTVNIRGAERILELSRKRNLKKNIFLSSLSAKLNASSMYGNQKRTIEDLFSTEKDAVLRLGLVVGDGGLVKQTVTQLERTHMLPLVAGGKQPIQYIAIANVLAATQKVIERDLHGTYVAASSASYTYKDFYKNLAKEKGIRIIPLSIPFSLLLFVIRFADMCHIPLGITEDNLLGLKKMSHINSERDLAALDLQISTLSDAFKQLHTRPRRQHFASTAFGRYVNKHLVLRYCLVGGVTYCIELSCLLGLYHLLHTPRTLAAGIAYWIGLLVGFTLQKIVAFQDYQREVKRLSKQGIAYGALAVWNYVFIVVVVGFFSSEYLIESRTGALIVMTIWNYFFYKRIVFKADKTA